MASFFDTLFSGGAQEDAAAKNAQALQTYQGTALPALQTGYNTGVTNLGNAGAAYQPLANLGQPVQPGWVDPLLFGANALGTNFFFFRRSGHCQAAQAARSPHAPGYSGAIDAEAVGNRPSARLDGRGQSAAMRNLDAQTFRAEPAKPTQYNTWLQNLSRLSGQGLTATGQAAQGQAAGDHRACQSRLPVRLRPGQHRSQQRRLGHHGGQ